MKKKFSVSIRWLSINENGKAFIPDNRFYMPILRVQNDLEDKLNWSVQLREVKTLDKYEKIAHMNYLMDNAPDNLSVGTLFSLFEGSKVVAIGKVLELVSNVYKYHEG